MPLFHESIKVEVVHGSAALCTVQPTVTWQQEGSHYATLLVMSDVGMGMPRAMPNSMVMPMPVTITSRRGLTLGGSDHGTDSG